MSPNDLAIACITAPLLAFFVAFVGFRDRHQVASGIVLVGGAISMVASLMLLVGYGGDPSVIDYRWFTIGDLELRFGALVDGRTVLMGAVVGVITFCIMLYSLFYMATDPGKGRFFAFLALFEWAMLNFVFAPNLLQGFIFWELVGLASFLLIGFWYRKPSAIAAAKKAFIMTRIGDVGLFIGLILLYQGTGELSVQALTTLFAADGIPAGMEPGQVELIAGLLFVGIVGKSAQFPLHTWLPDAMEGPTPVSALLHSATMVAAGVFLFARFHELFLDAPNVLSWVLWIAAFTAILASTMAMAAKDMKRVLAFSSISQLSFMLMGLGAGSLFAGMFHLITHAVFKALLFLCAGSFIHAKGSNDMVAIGRAGGRKLKATTIGLVAGGSALAGIPFITSGFYSKEAILGTLHHNHDLAPIYWLALFAAFLTAYYTFRMIFLVVMPNADSAVTEEEPAGSQHAHGDDDHGHGDHDAEPWVMKGPILVLSAGALVLGLPFFAHHIGGILGEAPHEVPFAEMVVPIAVALAGVLLAWFDFGRKSAPQTGFLARFPAVLKACEQRWYIDKIYQATFIKLSDAISSLSYAFETKGFDVAADKVGEGTLALGVAAARAHTGRLQLYIGAAAIGIAAIALYVGWS